MKTVLVAFRKYQCLNWGTLLVSRLCRFCVWGISPFFLACSSAMSSNSAVISRALFSLGALPSPPPSADLRPSGSSPTSISPQLHFSDGFFFPFLFPFPFLRRPPPRPRPWPEFGILLSFYHTNLIVHTFLSWNTYQSKVPSIGFLLHSLYCVTYIMRIVDYLPHSTFSLINTFVLSSCVWVVLVMIVLSSFCD